MKFNVFEVNSLIRSRRSVFTKSYSGERVPADVIRQMLENATWAPTHKLTEPWRFQVYSGAGLQKLGTLQANCYREVTQRNGTFDQARYDSLLTKPLEASHIILIAMQRDATQRVPAWEELGAVFCAVQNMYLTATAYGIGCYLSTGGVTQFTEANLVFGLQADDKICGFLHVGVPTEIGTGGKRKPVDEVTTWIEN
jgi:nitroreductase